MKYIVKLQSKGTMYCVASAMMKYHTISCASLTGAAVAGELAGLFAEELNPVAPKAQRKVPVPEG